VRVSVAVNPALPRLALQVQRGEPGDGHRADQQADAGAKRFLEFLAQAHRLGRIPWIYTERAAIQMDGSQGGRPSP
jgi:hypothetical protein